MDSKEEAEQPPSNMVKYLKIIKTTLLFLTWIAMGILATIGSSTLPDFRIRLNATVEEFSYAFTFASIGGLIGSLLSGVGDRFFVYAEAFLGICMLVSAVVSYIQPYVPTMWFYGICAFLDTLVWQNINAVSNAVMLSMWGTGTGSAMQAMQAGYPLGAVLGGLISIPFVSDSSDNNQTKGSYSKELPSDDGRFLDESSIENAFAIGASYTALIGIFHFVIQVIQVPPGTFQRQENSKWRDLISPSKWAAGDSVFGIKIFVLLVIYYIIQWSGVKGIISYLVTYAVDSDLGFTNQEAAALNSAMFAMGGVGRAAFILIAKYLTLYQTLFLTIHAQLVLSILLTIIGTKYKLGMWILLCSYAFFREPVWPSGFTWGHSYIILFAFALGFITVVTSVTDLLITPLQGYLYTNTVIESIFYTTVIFAVLLCLLLYIMYYVTFKRPSRFEDDTISVDHVKSKYSDESINEHYSKKNEISYL